MIITLYLIFCMLAVLWFDITRYIIPNWLVASMLLIYPLAVWLAPAPVDWVKALLGMAIVFGVGYVVFAKKWMGAGDVKLLVAGSLWVGLLHLMDFLFIVALLGGGFSILIYAVRKVPKVKLASGRLPRLLRDGEPMPYGIAIALGFLICLYAGYVPALAGAH